MTSESEAIPAPVVERMREHGAWNPLWDELYEWDPAWTEQYMATAMQPWLSGVLTPKFVELLAVAVDASATHMYAPGPVGTSARPCNWAPLARRSSKSSS